MSEAQWTKVDDYFEGLFTPPDAVLTAALEATAKAGMPAHSVSAVQGKFLHLLAKMHGARSILEIGTLGGYSTICFARALPPDGQIITLELSPAHAAVARANIANAGFAAQVEVRVGKAIDLLPALVGSETAPFDLVFIDADKASTPDYLTWAFRLTKPGSLIIIDNVVRDGAVADSTTSDIHVRGIQKALAMLANDSRVITTAMQTVGSKGYDGFALALVTGA